MPLSVSICDSQGHAGAFRSLQLSVIAVNCLKKLLNKIFNELRTFVATILHNNLLNEMNMNESKVLPFIRLW